MQTQDTLFNVAKYQNHILRVFNFVLIFRDCSTHFRFLLPWTSTKKKKGCSVTDCNLDEFIDQCGENRHLKNNIFQRINLKYLHLFRFSLTHQ